MASIHGWLRLTLTPQRLVFRSRLFWWSEHWLDSAGRSARCLGPGCVLCQAYPPRAMGCVAVQAADSPRIYLLKLPAGDADLLAQLDGLADETVGQVVDVCRISKDPAEGIELKLAGRMVTRPVPCERYVAAIGLKQYSLALKGLGLELPLDLDDNKGR